MKAQASLEQLVVIATSLAFVSIAFYIAASYSADSAKIAQARDAVDRLVGSADHVYALGPNSKEYVSVYLPEDLAGTNVSGKSISTRVYTTGGSTDVFASSKADLVGSLPRYRGRQRILVEYLQSGKVRIGEAGLSCSPSTLTKAINAGESASDSITIANTADYNITGINASLSGGDGLLSIGTPPASLLEGGNGSLSVSYSIPAGYASGVHGAIVTVESGNDGSCTSQITININGVINCANLCAAQGYTAGSCRAAAQDCVANGEDYRPENDATCDAGAPKCCCWPSADEQGPLVTAMNSTQNATTSTNVSVNITCDDTTRGSSYIKGADIQLDFGAWTPASPTSGAFSTAVVQGAYAQFGQLPAGQHIAIARCTDTSNKTGPVAYHYFNVTMGDEIGPIVTMMNHSDPYPTTLANITEMGTATELYTGNANIAECYVKVDHGDWLAVPAADGAYNSPTESFSYNIGQMVTGMHSVYGYCIDALGNMGGIHNDTFGVSAADMMLIMDRSGSMAWTITNASDISEHSTGSSSFTLVKSLTVAVKNGDSANVTVEMYASKSGCTAAFEARVGGVVIASGSRTSTSYGAVIAPVDVTNYSAPYTVDLYMKKIYGSSCTVYNRNFNLWQLPTKMVSAQRAANTFVDLVSNSSQMGLVSYSGSASTVRTLALMNSTANRTALKNSINGLVPSGSTCIECGLDNAVNELISSRGRYPEAVRVAILLTDGVGNVGDSVAGAVYARDNNVKVFTIGLGDDVDPTELTNIALLTYGKYYYAPDDATLQYIYQHIGE